MLKLVVYSDRSARTRVPMSSLLIIHHKGLSHDNKPRTSAGVGRAGNRSECSEMPHVCAHLLLPFVTSQIAFNILKLRGRQIDPAAMFVCQCYP
jgi:hypothetical protein